METATSSKLVTCPVLSRPPERLCDNPKCPFHNHLVPAGQTQVTFCKAQLDDAVLSSAPKVHSWGREQIPVEHITVHRERFEPRSDGYSLVLCNVCWAAVSKFLSVSAGVSEADHDDN